MNITELCVNCKQNNSCTMCWKTSNKKCPHFIQKTNADRIRAMSDEELAEYVYYGLDAEFCSNAPECIKLLDADDGIPEEKCKACALNWLKQSAEE